ncbi:SubName: Full=Uncharacterized protein {ECO:0000313/EMBL:CCA70851.1} [Serendipita indica DSM 11827]|uniref:F-box domain-containing protein n=1 Tax=Serendipita indica (strain DSM 11827) TaxID=1109443 RepID=G4THQ8_SERID|nr:SubName: Full=Uncharacterized protein {ECO:0000313/EMBL:CCA70851.1} [Serendipita indica DSM 11827]CCA70851.1 hypothetical protein PIIN_04786 [Serendipita indica DSM 11827]
MKLQEENIDYLSLLPSEIWRQILFGVYPPNPFFSKPGKTRDRAHWSRLLGIQARRGRLRFICKRLEPIAFEVLITEVALKYTKLRLNSFFDALSVNYGSPCTTRASIFFPSPRLRDGLKQEIINYNLLFQLPKYCPRLKYVVLDGFIGHNTERSTSWIKDVESIMINTRLVKCEALAELSARNPCLGRLCLYGTGGLHFQKPVVFPNLTHLSLDDPSVGNLAYISLPSLCSLSIAIDNLVIAELDAFIQANGQTIVYLNIRVNYQDLIVYSVEDTGGYINVIRHCPRLEVLEMDGALVYTDIPSFRHPFIRTIVLHVYAANNMVAALEWWGFDAKGNPPPNVTRVVIKPHGYHELTDNEMEQVMLSEVRLVCKQEIAAMFVVERDPLEAINPETD